VFVNSFHRCVDYVAYTSGLYTFKHNVILNFFHLYHENVLWKIPRNLEHNNWMAWRKNWFRVFMEFAKKIGCCARNPLFRCNNYLFSSLHRLLITSISKKKVSDFVQLIWEQNNVEFNIFIYLQCLIYNLKLNSTSYAVLSLKSINIIL
jgi:hypothetical protein